MYAPANPFSWTTPPCRRHWQPAQAAGRQLRPTVSWDGSTFVVAWDDQRNQTAFFDARTDVYATRVSEVGAVLDPQSFAVDRGPQGDCSPSLLSKPDGTTLVANARFIAAGGLNSHRIGLARIGTPCIADFDLDNDTDSDDIVAFFSSWDNGDSAADADGDGDTDSDDIIVFFAAWDAGC